MICFRLQHSLFNTLLYNPPSTLTYDHNVCICPRADPNATFSALSSGNKDSRATCFSQRYATCTDNIKLQGERKTCTIRNKRSVNRHKRNNERLLALSISDKKLNNRVRKVNFRYIYILSISNTASGDVPADIK